LRLKQKEEQAAADQAEINAVKENLRWNDGTLEQFTAWAQSVKPIDLARLWQSMVMSAQYRAPFVQNHSGSPVAPNSAMAQIERLFG
jgi:glycogen debranching enzyme